MLILLAVPTSGAIRRESAAGSPPRIEGLDPRCAAGLPIGRPNLFEPFRFPRFLALLWLPPPFYSPPFARPAALASLRSSRTSHGQRLRTGRDAAVSDARR